MIQPRYSVLNDLFSTRVFRVPRYQRFYSWRDKQRNDLFSDIQALHSQPDGHHFMATIVCHQTTEVRDVGARQYGVYDIVDGQQRITTLVLLLKCIELSMEKDSEEREELARILVKRDGVLVVLQINNANEQIFHSFVQRGVRPERGDIQTYSDKTMSEAIHHCSEFVSRWMKSDKVIDLMRLILNRLGFVVHDTQDARAVYRVFEVLNSRGLDVDWIDKTKSALMGCTYEHAKSSTAAEVEIDSLQKIWSDIYRELAKEDISGDEVLRIAATLTYGQNSGKLLSPSDALERIRDDCNHFDKPRSISLGLLDVASKLVKLQQDQRLGPVARILHARALAVALLSVKNLSPSDQTLLLSQLERVTFRIFGLCNRDARTGVGSYVKLACELSESPQAWNAKRIMKGLRGLGKGYEINRAVKEGLACKDCYDTSPENCRYILWLYEEHIVMRLGDGATVNESIRHQIWNKQAEDSIEHIFPQSPTQAWERKMRRKSDSKKEPVEEHVGRIGNLMLLPHRLNARSSNSSFPRKKEEYSKHSLRMAQEICKEEDWTLDHIEAREAKIIEWVKTRWADL